MEHDKTRLDYLLGRYLQESIDKDELIELGELFAELDEESLLTAIDRATALNEGFQEYRLPTEDNYQQMLRDPRIQLDPPKTEEVKSSRLAFSPWLTSIAAMFVVGFILFFKYYPSDDILEAAVNPTNTEQIVPGGDKAILTLADGRTINLDDLDEGQIADEMGVRISKTAEGQIFYEPTSESGSLAARYNRIETPRGGEYRLILPDGTKVWLNAASSLKYPTHFDDNIRMVELVGEAYFEVPQRVGNDRNQQSFVVETPMQRVEVLGTQFNVNAYPDVANEKTTLVEGKVRISAFADNENGSFRTLKPHEEATIDVSGRSPISVTQVDPSVATAWKDGYFAFADAHITDVMRTLSRWYDIEVVYENDLADTSFGGTISKFEDFSKLLEAIELTGSVRFEISGRRVIVMT